MSNAGSQQLRGVMIGVGSALCVALAAYIIWPESETPIQMGGASAVDRDTPVAADPTEASASLPGSPGAAASAAARRAGRASGASGRDASGFSTVGTTGSARDAALRAELESLELSPEAAQTRRDIEDRLEARRQRRERRNQEASQTRVADGNGPPGPGASGTPDVVINNTGIAYIFPTNPVFRPETSPVPMELPPPPEPDQIQYLDTDSLEPSEYERLVAVANTGPSEEDRIRNQEQLEKHVLDAETRDKLLKELENTERVVREVYGD